VFGRSPRKIVDGRDKPGHDVGGGPVTRATAPSSAPHRAPPIRRRDLIASLAAVATGLREACAPPKAAPGSGFLSGASPGPYTPYVAAFRGGLSEAGYVEGQNLAIEYRWAEGAYDRLPALAADLVGRKVDLIVASGGNVSVRAAKSTTATIPIVFTS